MKRTGCVLALVVLVAAAATARGQEMAVPMDIQYPLLLKVLSAERGFRARVGKELVIGILHQPRFRRSIDAKETLAEVIAKTPVTPLQTIPVRAVAVAIDGESELAAALADTTIDLCYVTPLRAINVTAVAAATAARRIMTCTGVPEYVEEGVAVGVDAKGGRPQILINLAAAKTEGIEFPSQLLRLATIVMR